MSWAQTEWENQCPPLAKINGEEPFTQVLLATRFVGNISVVWMSASISDDSGEILEFVYQTAVKTKRKNTRQQWEDHKIHYNLHEAAVQAQEDRDGFVDHAKALRIESSVSLLAANTLDRDDPA